MSKKPIKEGIELVLSTGYGQTPFEDIFREKSNVAEYSEPTRAEMKKLLTLQNPHYSDKGIDDFLDMIGY